ncbi:MAG TPA: DUF2336 domain-containing protein [Devosia sp.]|nr:DUF2336 domain-containing protein [Devosia sp.]
MLSSLLELARQPDSDKRRELLGAVSDMFYADGRDAIAEREMQLFAEVVTRLLKDLAEQDRAEFAGTVAPDGRTPRDVALALAHDTASVAAPVLQHSQALTEEDLIAVARERDTDHRVAISKRADVGEKVTDALLDFGETEVMETLLDNSTSKLSPRGFTRITDRAMDRPELRQRLATRRDAPTEALMRIMPLLPPDVQAHAKALLAQGGGRLDELAKSANSAMAKERLDGAKRRLEIKALARKFEAGELPIYDFVENLVANHHALDLALGLAEISMLPEKQVGNAILSTEAEPLALICKALEIGSDGYGLAEALRRECMKLPPDIPEALFASYDKVNAEQAQRALRFVQVRSSLAKTG